MELSKPDFIHWLEERNGNTVVGIRGESRCCPLACYLRDKTGNNYSVDTRTYDSVEASHELPAWAREFVDRIDLSYNPEISAEHALNVVNQIAEDKG